MKTDEHDKGYLLVSLVSESDSYWLRSTQESETPQFASSCETEKLEFSWISRPGHVTFCSVSQSIIDGETSKLVNIRADE